MHGHVLARLFLNAQYAGPLSKMMSVVATADEVPSRNYAVLQEERAVGRNGGGRITDSNRVVMFWPL